MKLRYRIGSRIIYWVWKVLFGFKVEGRENIPNTGGIIIAANHLSNYDPPLIGAAVWCRECYFFSKNEIFAVNKFYSWVMKAFNAYPINTKKPSKENLKYIETLLDKGLGLLFFPEGTRSRTGNFLKFNPGIGWFALRTSVPIVPTFIKGTNTSLISQLVRQNRVYVKFGTPILANKFKVNKEGRELFTQEVECKVRELAQ
ncbi:MAG: 1-acyl-sn-glycerol-3-phosphate acyltransferase [Candidatus Stahlbacteria bacterium]|nr:1-acyl-sn-glycerol-3-phosphate acyltransferase [Candidatus Stahlbacteria bacterium]